MNINKTYNNETYFWEDLKIFTPKLHGWRLYVFALIASIVALTAIAIQGAVYRSLKSLGARHINQMIIPSLVRPCLIYFIYW